MLVVWKERTKSQNRTVVASFAGFYENMLKAIQSLLYFAVRIYVRVIYMHGCVVCVFMHVYCMHV